MAKVLRTAALVVGAVALAATGVGALASIGAFGTIVAGSAAAATLTTVATIATVATWSAAALTAAAVITAKKPSLSVSGDQTKFTLNKDQGIPWPIGRTSAAGWIVHRATWDYDGSENNAYQTFFAAWGAGPIHSVEAFKVDGTTIAFSGDAALGGYAGYMWANWQLGATPEAAALPAASFRPTVPGWSTASKLSGYAAYSWTLKWDKKGKKFPSGVPQPSAILKGAKAWDPRKDSTYPGGSGSHRPNDPSTWEWTENPWLLAIQWGRGIFHNGKRVMGIGMALAAIDVPAYVEAANVADANGWKAGGVVYSTDGKWDVMKKLCAAGGGEPLQLGGLMSCLVNTPRVSLATIRTSDMIGEASVTATPAGKDRINGVIPRYRSEAHDWSIVPAAPVQVADYVEADGRPRTREVTWELVQNVDQVAELATYEIVNAREFGPIVTPLKLKWIGYKPGDCLTIASPELGMDSQTVLVLRRQLDPATGAVTLTSRSETTAKHAFALGKTGTPPPTPSLQVVGEDDFAVPGYNAGWSGVIDDDGNRPEDGATVGAPPGTNIGDIPVEVFISDLANVVADLSVNVESLFALTGHVGLLNDYLQAKTTLDGKPIGTVVVDVREVSESSVATLELIGAKNGDGTAFVLDSSAVMVSPTQSIGAKFSSIDTAIGDAASSVSFLMEAVVDTSGSTIAKAVLSLKAGPAGSMRVSGIVATNDGTISTLDLDFDRTRIFRPDGELLFLADEDGVYMPNVEIDRVKINSVAVPVYASSSSVIAGAGTSATVFEGYTATMSESITLPVGGAINIDALVGMSFSAAPSVWQLQLLCDGVQVDFAGGVNSQENVPLMAQIERPAGTYTLELKFGGHTASTVKSRKLRATGHPYTG